MPSAIASPDRPSLLYDGACRVCALFAHLIALADFRHGLEMFPLQGRRARRLLPGQTQQKVARTVHFVTPEGQIYEGAEAFDATLSRLPIVGPVRLRLGGRALVARLVRTLYGVGVGLREGLECAT